ncbi:acetylcholinesterase [Trichoderma harzianum]|uniref:Carboxylic ester hydrolase n=1 Tax=Trichoderma harzianum TaxID=5544 RepID=A0A0F9X8H6_TRIHA|nr:acetylcholinesterase [Trichoderma harzianum]
MRISAQILISILAGFSLAVPATPINIESTSVERKSVDSGANANDSSKDRLSPSSLQVNVGYAKYKGYFDSASDLNIWKGIRYAAAPIGNLRWQPPRFPATEPSAQPIPATDFGPLCPQAYLAVPGVPNTLGNEDCLFLNVYAPSNASRLPVLVYIHGGGYGFGDGTLDISGKIKLFIGQFGGDPLSITISGDSAGGSSALYHDMAAEAA